MKLNNSLQQFIATMRQPENLNYIVGDREVCGVVIMGSALIDLIDDRSDYDIIVIVPGDKPVRTKEQQRTLHYEGKLVHWWYLTPSYWLQSVNWTDFSAVGGVWFAALEPEHFIYVNERYADEIQAILDNRQKGFLDGCKTIYKANRENYIKMVQEQTIFKGSKRFYYTCYANVGLGLSELNLRLLGRVKRMLHSRLLRGEIKWLLDEIAKFVDYMEAVINEE